MQHNWHIRMCYKYGHNMLYCMTDMGFIWKMSSLCVSLDSICILNLGELDYFHSYTEESKSIQANHAL